MARITFRVSSGNLVMTSHLSPDDSGTMEAETDGVLDA